MYENICGITPLNFTKIVPEGSNYIFTKDPSFIPITLKNFFGSVVQVNSFEECYYYAELGWSNSKITIFEIGQYFVIFLFTLIFLYVIKKNSGLIKSIISKSRLKLSISSLYKFFINTLIIFQLIIAFRYVKNKSINLKPFIDEYVSISSNYHLLTGLDFNAGQFLGGTFSVYLTSGPLASLGSIIGWISTNNIFYARIFNYFWVVTLLLISTIILSRKFQFNTKHYLIFVGVISFLFPWWQGYLYSLGEIPSIIVLLTAILLFHKNRKLSLALFGFSIFLGKFLNFLLFFTFYLAVFIQSRNSKMLLRDIISFLVPLAPWFILIHITYSGGGLFTYFNDLYLFISDSSASGLQEESRFNFSYLKNSILQSEYLSWNIYEKVRIGVLPLLGISLIAKNRKLLDSKFGNISFPIIFSFFSVYLWFWILNQLKWMRYSQHFTVFIILLILYLIIFEIYENKIDYLFSSILIVLYVDNTKKYLIYYLIILLFIYVIKNINNYKLILVITTSLILTFDISYSIFTKDNKSVPNLEIIDCNITLNTDACRSSYFDILNE